MGKIIFLISVSLIVFLYFYRLDMVPPHLNQDEMMFGLNAYTIAKFGTDFYGNRMPFYFWHLGSFWATPIVVYTTSLFLKFLPLSEATIRASGAFVGVLGIFLMGVLGRRVFGKGRHFLLGLLLAGTVPVLFINSRIAMDVVWTVPFVATWLLFLRLYSDKGKWLMIFLAGLALGVGIHSYHAAKVMMPLYFLATLAYLVINFKQKALVAGALFTMGFAIPVLAFIPWLVRHPDTLLNQVSYVGSLDKTVKVGSGIWGVFNLSRLRDFAANYITYFSPKILFVEGDRSLIHSTGKVGAFAFGLVLPLVFGIVEALRRKKDWFAKLVLFGFLTYPMAPAIVNDPQRISRGLVVVPFAILLVLYGISFLLAQRQKAFKYLVVGVLVFTFLEFAFFVGDYFGDYRLRSSGWFNNSIGGLYGSVMKSTEIRKVDKIYIDSNIYFAENYFDFYQIKLGKNLKGKTFYFNPQTTDFTKLPQGTLVAIAAGDIPGKPDKTGGFEKIETIRELTGYETFLVYYKDK